MGVKVAVVALGFAGVGVGVAHATSPDEGQQYTACLNPAAGQILNAAIGTSPRMPC